MSKKILSVLLAIVVMASLCMISASADEANVLSTKTTELHKDDTVTYTVSLKYGTDRDLVAALNALVTYDNTVLEIDKKASKFPVTGAPTINYKADGTIKFNAANGTAGFNFADGGDIAVFTFKVIADAANGTEIKFNTAELFNVVLVEVDGEDIPDEAQSNKAITTGCSAKADVTCPHKAAETTDSEKKDDTKASDTEVKASDTEKKADEKTTEEAKTDANTAPKTGDVATVVMMLVFAAAAVVVIAKKREA